MDQRRNAPGGQVTNGIELRAFGKTDLRVSVIGFGAWGIGGPAMAGTMPIGWGDVDDAVSMKALRRSLDRGINFFDTADFYGLGHSEELIGEVFGDRSDIVVATKVGHRLNRDGSITLDYSKKHILNACEQSLRRLRRATIDYYQLHSAGVAHLQQGECVEAMELLKAQGKIRYWGISLSTFHPEPEAEFLLQHAQGDGFQVVVNIINQRAIPLMRRAHQQGYGIIARMPLQFGLLTGKFSSATRFGANDHRSFRLTPSILEHALMHLENVWPLADKYNISKTSLGLSFCASIPEVSTVIPGIKTPEQVDMNTSGILSLSEEDREWLAELYRQELHEVVEMMEQQG